MGTETTYRTGNSAAGKWASSPVCAEESTGEFTIGGMHSFVTFYSSFTIPPLDYFNLARLSSFSVRINRKWWIVCRLRLRLRRHILRHQLNGTNTQPKNGSGRCCQYRFFEVELRKKGVKSWLRRISLLCPPITGQSAQGGLNGLTCLMKTRCLGGT